MKKLALALILFAPFLAMLLSLAVIHHPVSCDIGFGGCVEISDSDTITRGQPPFLQTAPTIVLDVSAMLRAYLYWLPLSIYITLFAYSVLLVARALRHGIRKPYLTVSHIFKGSLIVITLCSMLAFINDLWLKDMENIASFTAFTTIGVAILVTIPAGVLLLYRSITKPKQPE